MARLHGSSFAVALLLLCLAGNAVASRCAAALGGALQPYPHVRHHGSCMGLFPTNPWLRAVAALTLGPMNWPCGGGLGLAGAAAGEGEGGCPKAAAALSRPCSLRALHPRRFELLPGCLGLLGTRSSASPLRLLPSHACHPLPTSRSRALLCHPPPHCVLYHRPAAGCGCTLWSTPTTTATSCCPTS